MGTDLSEQSNLDAFISKTYFVSLHLVLSLSSGAFVNLTKSSLLYPSQPIPTRDVMRLENKRREGKTVKRRKMSQATG